MTDSLSYPRLVSIASAGRPALFLVLAIAACVPASAQPITFASPDQFVVDKDTDVVGIVKVTRVESRWVLLPDGDHVPLVVAECNMEEALTGATSWPVGTVASIAQADYSDLIFEPISPSAIQDRRYVLWASQLPSDEEISAVAPWTAHPQGMLLIRRRSNQEFVFWNGKSYSITALRQRITPTNRCHSIRSSTPCVG